MVILALTGRYGLVHPLWAIETNTKAPSGTRDLDIVLLRVYVPARLRQNLCEEDSPADQGVATVADPSGA